MQLALCIPEDLEGLGDYHMAIAIDVAEGGAVDSEACRSTLVDTLNEVAVAAADTADVAGYCGKQWGGWGTLSFGGAVFI